MIGELYSNQWKYIKLFILKFKASKKCSMIDDENEDEAKKKTTSSKENFPMVMKIKK